VESLYLMMGRALEWLPAVPAGNVVAIGGLQDTVLKSATLSTTPAACALAPVEHQAEAIVQVIALCSTLDPSKFQI
jgi:ribosome assembly protein 1